MKQRACDARSEAHQLCLSGEHFYPSRARHLRKIHRAAVANLGYIGFGCGDARNLRQYAAGMDQQLLDPRCRSGLAYLLQGVTVFDCEFGDCGPAQAGQVGSDTEFLPRSCARLRT